MKQMYLGLFLGLTGLFLAGCGDDDAFFNVEETGNGGMPSLFLAQGDGSAGFRYDGQQWNRIYWADGGSTEILREDDPARWTLRTDPAPDVADGHGETSLERTAEGRVRIERWGEPSFQTYVDSMELDETGYPTSLTLPGSIGYVRFTYDKGSHTLESITRYALPDSTVECRQSFTYDDRKGTLSEVALPDEWLKVYLSYRYGGDNPSAAQFFSWHHNVTSITTEYPEDGRRETVVFSYEYNTEGFPIGISDENGRKTTVRY